MGIFSTTDNNGGYVFYSDSPSDITIKAESVTTEEDVKTLINNYDKERLFSDEILINLLEDKIQEKAKELLKEKKEKEIKEKKNNIDLFISCIEKVIYSNNRTIVFWTDGTKTVVKCDEEDDFDREKGLALCIIKHIFGDIGYYNEIFKSFELNSYNVKKDILEFKKTKKADFKGIQSQLKKILNK